MDLIDHLAQIAARIPAHRVHLATEEATKNALVLPLINALGYNVFDPTEVVPEFIADVGTKKGEKVDYVIMRDGKPAILIECKSAGSKLSINHASQLFRYFTTTDARFAVLTDGIEYQFYTDIEAPNKMDSHPFFEFSMLSLDTKIVEEIKKFSKQSFDLNNILCNASELKYKKQIRGLLANELNSQ
uniref:type I restriction endonuclease n=1 Tax=Tautonia marina TaxID=2653855 RepID=UPI00191BD0AC